MTADSDDLRSRAGLPDPLRILLAEYPRAGWERDGGKSDLVMFWLERHLAFRNILKTLREDTEALIGKTMDFQVFAPRFAQLGNGFLNALHGHHMIEDMQYFPRLAQIDGRLDHGFRILDADHHALDEELESLAGAANGVLNGGPPLELADTLERLDGFLDRHLTDEEDLIVPVILKSGFRG